MMTALFPVSAEEPPDTAVLCDVELLLTRSVFLLPPHTFSCPVTIVMLLSNCMGGCWCSPCCFLEVCTGPHPMQDTQCALPADGAEQASLNEPTRVCRQRGLLSHRSHIRLQAGTQTSTTNRCSASQHCNSCGQPQQQHHASI